MGSNNYRDLSPSSSPPRVLKWTPTVSNLPPLTPSSSCSLQLTAKSHLQQALDYINREDFETHRLLLDEFSWCDFDLFFGELSHPLNITLGRAAKLWYYHFHDAFISFEANRDPQLLLRSRNIHPADLPDAKADPQRAGGLYHHGNQPPRRRGTITKAEEDLIEFGYATNISLPFRNLTPQVGQKVPGFVKQPDAYFAVRDGGRSMFPRVVFEVAFSHSYVEVRADVDQCLERTHGAVQLALLFAITEHPIVGPAGHDSTTSDSDTSSPESYRHLHATCDDD